MKKPTNVVDVYSKRQKLQQLERNESPDVFEHEIIPKTLRVQITDHIWEDVFGAHWHFDFEKPGGPSGFAEDEYLEEKAYMAIEKEFCRNHGETSFLTTSAVHGYYAHHFSGLVGGLTPEEFSDLSPPELSIQESLRCFFHNTQKTEEVLDIVEISFRYMEETFSQESPKACEAIDNAIAELNRRFLEHGVGYEYSSGQIIRIDSLYHHTKIVRPVLYMLSKPMYEGAEQEFRAAHEHYQQGGDSNYKACLNESFKAFESCIKAICHKRDWPFNKKCPVGPLIKLVIREKLVPEGSGCSLKSVATLRNEMGAHGQGIKKAPVPKHIAEYALNLTASSILLLTRANEKYKKR